MTYQFINTLSDYIGSFNHKQLHEFVFSCYVWQTSNIGRCSYPWRSYDWAASNLRGVLQCWSHHRWYQHHDLWRWWTIRSNSSLQKYICFTILWDIPRFIPRPKYLRVERTRYCVHIILSSRKKFKRRQGIKLICYPSNTLHCTDYHIRCLNTDMFHKLHTVYHLSCMVIILRTQEVEPY